MPQRSSRVSAEVIAQSTVPLYYVIDLDRNYLIAEMNLDDLEKRVRDRGVPEGLEACNRFKCQKFPFVFQI